jgi:NAD(P)-dependent dehydrogenase (short-subunit alcohol dehydrogenase family)
MKVVAITGGGQGIGRGIAYHFAAKAYAVSLCDADEAAAREAADHIRSQGGTALAATADIAAKADVDRWMARTVAELGAPDVLVNNAGTMHRVPFLELAKDDFDRVLAVNLGGAMLCTQAAARAMVAAGKHGCIVNIASTRAFMSEPNTESYSASKGGIVALTHATAISLAPNRIRVNCISPGWIEVRDWKRSDLAGEPHHSEEDREQHPVGRVGKPEDIAEACFFLAEHADFMTGQNIVIDGGMTVKMIYAE